MEGGILQHTGVTGELVQDPTRLENERQFCLASRQPTVFSSTEAPCTQSAQEKTHSTSWP